MFAKQVPILVHSSSPCSSIVATVPVEILVVVSVATSAYYTADVEVVVLVQPVAETHTVAAAVLQTSD